MTAEYDQLVALRLRRCVPIEQPLVLISQIHRSGGTLLLRLLDGHPNCHTIPHELGPLLPRARVPFDQERAWRLFTDEKFIRRFQRGIGGRKSEAQPNGRRHPPLIPPLLVRTLFEARWERAHVESEREVLDAYLTAYLNGWLDYQSLYADDKRWLVGFEPGAITQPERIARFFRLYPDGRLLSIIRDPWTWYASARGFTSRFEHLEVALRLWRDSVLAATEAKERHPERVMLLSFGRLITETRPQMLDVVTFLGLPFTSGLGEPTINGIAAGANSSVGILEAGVCRDPVERRRELLSPEEIAGIDRAAGAIYKRALLLTEASSCPQGDEEDGGIAA